MFHVSERPHRSKLLLRAIRDTADQSIRGMKHKSINGPELPKAPAHARHMVAFGLDGFSPGKQVVNAFNPCVQPVHFGK